MKTHGLGRKDYILTGLFLAGAGVFWAIWFYGFLFLLYGAIKSLAFLL